MASGSDARKLGAAHGNAGALEALLDAFGNSTDRDLPGPAERNAYLARTDGAGKSALRLAEDAGHTEAVGALRRFGAK